jgi:alpha/beta superfamily hydrolase
MASAKQIKNLMIHGPAGEIEIAVHDYTDTPKGIALIAHPHPLFGGTMENKVVQTLAKTFTELNYIAVRFNFRGIGKSTGSFDEGMGETEDAIAVLKYVFEQVGQIPVVLAGFSFGCYVQTRVAERMQAKRLVLIAPAVKRFAVGNVPADTLIVHGEQDDVVPLADVFDWARPQQLPIVVLPGVGHYFHGRLAQLQEIVTQSWKS